MENKEIPMDYHVIVITATVAIPNYGLHADFTSSVCAFDYIGFNDGALLLGSEERHIGLQG